MLVRPQIDLAVLALIGPAQALTPGSSAAVLQAIRTGEIIGAAAACRVPEDRLVAVGRKVIHGIRAVAVTSTEVDPARVRHEQVQRGAMVQSGRMACEAALNSFAVLDQEPSS